MAKSKMLAEMMGTPKRRKKGRKGKRKTGSYAGWKQVSRKVCLRGKGRLKKGCKWGRGKYKGKIFKKVGR